MIATVVLQLDVPEGTDPEDVALAFRGKTLASEEEWQITRAEAAKPYEPSSEDLRPMSAGNLVHALASEGVPLDTPVALRAAAQAGAARHLYGLTSETGWDPALDWYYGSQGAVIFLMDYPA